MSSIGSCLRCGKQFRRRPRTGRTHTFCSTTCVREHKHSAAGTAARFWSKVDKSRGPDGCWLWLAGKGKNGYGKFSIGPKGANVLHGAHRFAYELAGGVLGDLCACHTCDTPSCVNPAHIFPGSNLDNMRDMVAKGRHATGERIKTHRRFTADQVRGMRAARADGEPTRSIASRFGLEPNQIELIFARRHYAWVT